MRFPRQPINRARDQNWMRTGWTFGFRNLLPRGDLFYAYSRISLCEFNARRRVSEERFALRFPCQRVFTCRLIFRDVANCLVRSKPLRVFNGNLFENSLNFAWPEFARVLTLWIPINELFSAILFVNLNIGLRRILLIDRFIYYIFLDKYNRVSAILIVADDWIGTKRY